MKRCVLLLLSLLGPSLLSAQEGTPPDVEGLVEQLRSDDPAAREAAEATLVERGPGILPALKKHENSRNFEVRTRVRRISAEIRRRTRLASFRPAPVRLTLALSSVPLSEALRRTFEPFGIKSDVWPRELENRPVSLTLKEATLWEALEIFSAQASIHLEHELTMPELCWGFRDGPPEDPMPSVVVGECRLWAETDSIADEKRLTLQGRLPPGHLPVDVEFEDLEIVDERGKTAPFDTELTDATAWRNAVGPTHFQSWRWEADRKALAEVRSVTVRGTLVLGYPKDVERVTHVIKDLKGPTDVTLGGVTLTLLKVTAEDGSWGHETRQTHWDEGTPRQQFRIWFEKPDGSLYSDSTILNVGGKFAGGTSRSLRGKDKILPAKIVVGRFLGRERVRHAFELKNVPLR